MLVFEERGKMVYPAKKFSEQRRKPTTNSTHKSRRLWRGILDKNVIGSYHKVHYIEFACILSYRTRYAVMSYSLMLYCNRNTVLSYSVTLHRNQNSIVSYSDADVSYPVCHISY